MGFIGGFLGGFAPKSSLDFFWGMYPSVWTLLITLWRVTGRTWGHLKVFFRLIGKLTVQFRNKGTNNYIWKCDVSVITIVLVNCKGRRTPLHNSCPFAQLLSHPDIPTQKLLKMKLEIWAPKTGSPRLQSSQSGALNSTGNVYVCMGWPKMQIVRKNRALLTGFNTI